jgi:hypothetical protein
LLGEGGELVAAAYEAPHAPIVDEETFALISELEIRKAVRLSYPVSMLAILPDPMGGGAAPDPRPLAEQLAGVLCRVVRGTDLIRLPAASAGLHALLVDAESADLPGIIERITEEVAAHQFRLDGERRGVTLSVGGASFPTTVATSQELLVEADTRAR